MCLSVTAVSFEEGESRRASVHSIASRAEMHKRPNRQMGQARPFLLSLSLSLSLSRRRVGKRNKATRVYQTVCPTTGQTIFFYQTRGSGLEPVWKNWRRQLDDARRSKEKRSRSKRLSFAGNYVSFTGTCWTGHFLIRSLSFFFFFFWSITQRRI